MPQLEKCEWTQDGDEGEGWYTDCKRHFCLNEGGPKDNGMNYCCYCGRWLREILFEYDVEEEDYAEEEEK